jgi:hypothetical protein
MASNPNNVLLSFVGQPAVYGQAPRSRFMPPVLDKDEVPAALLDMRHPEFDARFESWIDLSLLYEGGNMLKARAERVLKKRPREDEEVYAARMDRFTYENILATGLGWYGAAMFDTPPEIFFDGKKREPKQYAEFLDNCDGIGTSYVDFWKKIYQYMLTYGSAWVLTDLRALEDDEDAPVTLQEERDRGFLDPHLVVYTPMNVINWRTDKRGELEWAVVKTEVEEQDFLQPRKIVSTWYYYDRTSFKVYQDVRSPEEVIRVATDDSGRTAKLINQGTHSLAHVSRLPIRKIMLTDGLWIANRAYLHLIDHLNQDNTLAWALFMSNLAIPIVIGDVDASNMTMSEVGYLQFPAGTQYQWSEPGGVSFTHSANRVDALREECFRSMNLQAQGRSMHATPAMQSGRSKQLEMAPAKQILTGMGDDVRRHMELVLDDVRDARKEPDVKPDVRGFSFKDDMTTEQVFAVNSVLSMRIPSKNLEKYLYKKVAKAWMEDASREELEDVYVQIDEGPTQEEREQDEFKKRVNVARANVKQQLQLPPGRGGDGPNPQKNFGTNL